MELKNKTVIVTGSRRGIGLAIAHAFAREGANVVLNGTREIPADIVAQFETYEGKVDCFVGDVSKFEVAEQLITQTKEKFGSVDVLVNNAGITRDGLLMRMSETDFDDVININLKGCFNTIRFAAPIMLKQKAGAIVNISSLVGLMGNAGQANYAASKAGVIGLTKSTARELASRGITVNAIAPGFIETDMTDALSDKVVETIEKQIPLKRMGHVEDIADTCLFLVKSNYITGQVIKVDGGMYI